MRLSEYTTERRKFLPQKKENVMMRSITVVCLMMIAAFASVTAYAEDKKQAPVVKTTGIEKSFLEGHDTFRQKHDDAHEIARIVEGIFG